LLQHFAWISDLRDVRRGIERDQVSVFVFDVSRNCGFLAPRAVVGGRRYGTRRFDFGKVSVLWLGWVGSRSVVKWFFPWTVLVVAMIKCPQTFVESSTYFAMSDGWRSVVRSGGDGPFSGGEGGGSFVDDS